MLREEAKDMVDFTNDCFQKPRELVSQVGTLWEKGSENFGVL